MSKRKVRKPNKTRRKRRRIVPLNLPDSIWQQYKKSLENESSVLNCTEVPDFKASHSHICSENVEKSNSAKENEQENKCEIQNKTVSCKNLMESKNIKESDKGILKQLAVKVDNSFAVKYNCFVLKETMNESLGIHKSITESIMSTKQILTNYSVRALIQDKEKNDFLSNHLISADSQLDEVFKLIQKQESILLSLQKTFHETSLPLSICNTLNTEEVELHNISTSITNKQQELEMLQQKNYQLQNQLQNNKKKLISLERICKKQVEEKEKCILHLKKKLYIMKKRLGMMMQENDQNIIETTVKPTQTQIQQLQNLMMLNNSLMKNILGEQVDIISSDKNLMNQDKIIDKLRIQINELKKQNKEKDIDLQRLMIAEKQTKNQLLVLQKRKKTEDDHKNSEINQLTFTLNNLKKKHDRWLVDKFYQKCHSIMLYEKVRQIERKQNRFPVINKLECNESKQTNSDNR